jgi:hypothetical protein
MNDIKTIKVSKMSEGMKSLIGRKQSKNFKFMGEDVKIHKLTVGQVMEIQEQAKGIEGDETKGFDTIKSVIRYAVEGAEDLSDEDFDSLPLDDLNTLSEAILKFSGMDVRKAMEGKA